MADEIVSNTPIKRPKTMKLAKDLAQDYMDSLERLINGERHHIDSCFKSLDAQIPAWLHEGHLIIVAGRPAMGKSVFGQMIAEHVASTKTAMLFTLEMSSYEITERSISRRSGIPIPRLKCVEKIQDNDWSKIANAVDQFGVLSFLVDDSSFDINALINKAKAAAAGLVKVGMPPLGCIVIDYLQLIGASGANRNLEITQITGALKRLSKELAIPVIALSQLNRSVEGRQDKRPTLADLRESGAIEQDADLVMFLYRDEYYTKELCADPGTAEVITAKNRHGATGIAKLAFIGERVMFGDLATDHPHHASGSIHLPGRA